MRDLCSCIDDWAYLATMEKQIEAWKELRRVDALMRRLGNRYPIVRAFSRLESKISCSLDGYDASLEDVLSYPERYIIERRRTVGSERAILNYLYTLGYGTVMVRGGQPLDWKFVRELHRQLCDGLTAAEPVLVAPRNMASGTMDDLFAWWDNNDISDSVIDDIIRFHYRFLALRPFAQGTGRMSRLLLLLQLIARGVLHEPILTMSIWLEGNIAEYRTCLDEAILRGNEQPLLMFFHDGFSDCAGAACNSVVSHSDSYRM